MSFFCLTRGLNCSLKLNKKSRNCFVELNDRYFEMTFRGVGEGDENIRGFKIVEHKSS